METIARFGPAAMSIEPHQPAFTMWVGTIEPGPPAGATGAFKRGQVIESINGHSLRDIDPRSPLEQVTFKEQGATDSPLMVMKRG